MIPEEAYYWNYAQHLNWSYLDHPPMVAWLIWLGTWIFGDNEFGVRIGTFFCGIVTALLCFGLARHLFDKSTAMLALLLVTGLPFFFVLGMFATPDGPLIACWAGALFPLERALLGQHRRAWWGVGVMLGMGMLSKYTIVLLVPATLVLLLRDRRWCFWLRRPELYAVLLTVTFLFMPVIVWNMQHDWASFMFQGPRRMAGTWQFSLHLMLLYAMVLLTPVGLIGIIQALWSKGTGSFLRRLRRKNVPVPLDSLDLGDAKRLRYWFIVLLTLLPLSVFVLYSIMHRPKLSWTGPIWLAVLPLLAGELLARRSTTAPPVPRFPILSR